MIRKAWRVSTAAVAGILITIGGCSEHPSALSDGDGLQTLRLVEAPLAPSFNRGGAGMVSQVIGPQGGTLQIPGGHTLSFPAGALGEPTTITGQAGGRYVEVDLGPHGLQFPADAKPTLTLSYAGVVGISPSSLTIVYIDGSGRIAENLGGVVNSSAKTVSVGLAHFSKYAIATGH